MTEATSHHLIELRVNNVAQLFHTLDPFPFRERDLDKEAEEFIVGWARELSADRAIKIAVHYPESRFRRMRLGVERGIPSLFFRTPAPLSERSRSFFGLVGGR